MAIANLQDNLSWLILRASMTAKHRLMRVSDEYDLSPMQALSLCLLEPGQIAPMSMISDLLSCDPSNVTGIVERLSVGKLIERRESSVDRRVKTITLTPAGEQLREEIIPKITLDGTPDISNLSNAEVAMLKELLTKTLPKSTTSKYFQK